MYIQGIEREQGRWNKGFPLALETHAVLVVSPAPAINLCPQAPVTLAIRNAPQLIFALETHAVLVVSPALAGHGVYLAKAM